MGDRMKLRSMGVTNFGCIGDPGCTIEIDDIVVLIGRNNVGKSTMFDAYEALAGTGSALPLASFHNQDASKTIEIAATFGDLTTEDFTTLGGNKWAFDDELLGQCIRLKWVWNQPDSKGSKYSWEPATGEWVAGGMGGWDTLIASRVPVPLRVRPTDDAATTEAQVTDILVSAAKAALKSDRGRAAKVLEELKKLNAELAGEISDQLSETVEKISGKLEGVFPGYSVQFDPQIGKFEPEKALGVGSQVHVKAPGCNPLPLGQQGAGLRRTFLWTALGTLADLGRATHGKKLIEPDRQRVLLIEEPEAFLHPPMVRAAREALYLLAEVPEWQVIASTHSPVFIDVAKPHTTIVRVARDGGQSAAVFATDRAAFTNEERENLKMIRACHPTVNEFFFADRVWLVEGETEHAALSVLLDRHEFADDTMISVVNCVGKANLPTFAKILNQFGSPYTVIHDSDAPRVKRNGAWQGNAMWTMNQRILDAIAERNPAAPTSCAVCHVPDFESYYFGERLKSDKPYHCLQELNRDDFEAAEELGRLRSLVPDLLAGAHSQAVVSLDQTKARLSAWVADNPQDDPEAWVTA
jgi:putative ATP-dependent endonuclease of the OLD family